jgi:hypothetical protein
MITYDRCCRLMTYCLKREAWFFRFTKFLVDGLHFSGHTACSESFGPKTFKAASARSAAESGARGNSQGAEQLNSRLIHLKKSLSFMTLPHFMLYLRVFLSLRNLEKKKVLLAKPR